jgi:uncharacterized protein (TIGR02271 family)
MAKTVVGLFDTSKQAHNALEDLVRSGFSRESISMVASEEEKGTGLTEGEKRAKGAVKGAGTGAAIGGVAGLAAGLASLAIPGIGPIIAAGPLASTLAGAGLGAVAGGLIGALTKMGVPEEEARHYAEGVRRGGTLLTVNTDDASAERAADIMTKHGAVDIDRRAAQWKETGWKGFDEKARPYTAAEKTKEREAVLPVVEEQVKVGKREVARGGVRVYSHITETPVQEEVTLHEERAKVERRPVDRPATAADREAFREESIEIRETGEEPVISKEARVKEEVVVGKEAADRKQTIRETVRRTDVEVEKLLDNEEDDFRRHFNSRYSSMGEDYSTYRSAYRYAGTMSQEKRYHDKEWIDIENDARKDWERDHPGTWAKYREAIQYGWEKMGRRRAGAGRG